MKKFVSAAVVAASIMLFPFSGYSDESSSDGITLSLGGNGLLYSIGYEKIMGDFAIDAGGSVFHAVEKGTGKNIQLYSVPLAASYLIDVSDDRHYVEAGLGVTFSVLSSTMNSSIRETDAYIIPVLSAGYRYQADRWFVRLALTPFYGTRPLNDGRPGQSGFSLTGNGIQMWGGITFGFRL